MKGMKEKKKERMGWRYEINHFLFQWAVFACILHLDITSDSLFMIFAQRRFVFTSFVSHILHVPSILHTDLIAILILGELIWITKLRWYRWDFGFLRRLVWRWVCWVVAPRSLIEIYRRFRCALCLQLIVLMTEPINVSELSVNFHQIARRKISEDSYFLGHTVFSFLLLRSV
jgi:hypothetical protein